MASYRIDTIEPEQVVLITNLGTLSLEQHVASANAALAAARERGWTRFLSDNRQLDVALSVVEIYEWPRQLKQLGLTATMRVAVVHGDLHPDKNDFRFLGDVAFNDGLPLLQVFDDYDRALDWLRGA